MSSRIDPEPVASPPAADPPPRPSARRPAAAAAAAVRPPRHPVPGAAADPARAPDAIRQAPPWAISMLVHVVALLGMALIVGTPPKREAPRIITASPPEVEEEFMQFEAELLDRPPLDVVAPAVDVAASTDVSVTPVDLVTGADDLDAAPLAIDRDDLGPQSPAAADMLATLGAVGGTAGGVGGRAQAARLAAVGGGGSDTEQAVDRALRWIAIHQLPDGGWSFDFADCPSCGGKCSGSGGSRGKDRTGATAMALLPFLGRGYTHRQGPYKPTIGKGIAFLERRALDGNGRVYDRAGNLYSQGLAGIALSECFAMSRDSRLARPTQLALDFISQAQDPVGGGWRYEPGQPGDTSAVGWQIIALKSGNLASLQVNPLTVKKAIGFLNSVESQSGARYGYLDNSRFSPGLTAVGLLCRMYLGWKKDNPALLDGVAYLAKTGPTADLYYDYYATQVMHHMEGDVWVSWNERMKPLLLESQSRTDHEAGSWHEGFHKGHAAEAAGRLYCTSMATMMLEVYYRHLPIYRTRVLDDEFQE